MPGAWKSGLCDCCSTPACCLACCCPCCVFGQIGAAMTPAEVCCGGDYCGSCCLYYILIMPTQYIDVVIAPLSVGSIALPLGTLIHCPMRSAIRKKHQIPGNDCEDCLIVWCCACCALAQVDSPSNFHQGCTLFRNLLIQISSDVSLQLITPPR